MRTLPVRVPRSPAAFVLLVSLCFASVILASDPPLAASRAPGSAASDELPGASNPAAVYCTLLGYRYEVVNTDRGAQGICVLPDGRRVDAWEFFRGRTAPEFSYCARRGLRTGSAELGDDSYSAECAVCVDSDGTRVGTIIELMDLDRTAGLERGPAIAPHGTQPRPRPEPGPRARPRSAPASRHRDLPPSFDWRDSDGCAPIRDQRSCGSCWAFGTLASLECNIRIRDRLDADLSEQWLVSCNDEDWGCGGGFNAHEYLLDHPDPCGGTGVVLESDFPYAAQDLPCACPYPHQPRYSILGWDYVTEDDAIPPIDSMKQAILDFGPISVSLAAGGTFGSYSGGIFSNCGYTNISHLVSLVGWDDTQGPEGVWILRNSWGTGWGEDGYMRIVYGCDRVGYDAAWIDYPGLTPLAFDFAEHVGSAPAGDGTVYLTGTITNISEVDDVITITGAEAGGWPVELRIDGDAEFSQSHPEPLARGESKGITVRVRTDSVKRIGTAVVSGVPAQGRTVELALRIFNGSPSVLLVDDDNGAGWQTRFLEGLDGLGYLCDVTTGAPTASVLRGFDAVIWQTGYAIWTIKPQDRYAIADYLDSGGALFLSSMDFLTGLTAPDAFVSGYLGVSNWTVNTGAQRAVGVPGDPITNGMNLALTWPQPNANRVDTLVPGSGAAVILRSESGNPAAVRFEGPGFRTVFSTVAQNALSTSDPDPDNSEAVIGNVLAWLLGSGPSNVEPGTAAAAPFLRASPNPAHGIARLSFGLQEGAGRVRLTILDAAGRKLRSLWEGPLAAGPHRISWDCTDDLGRAVPSGCYFARLETALGVSTRRTIILR